MTANNFLNYILDGGGILLVLLLIVQIAPIKVNPWSYILKAMGHLMNGEVIDLINKRDADMYRYRILRFDDELRHKQKHTKEHFDQMIEDIDGYERYCKSHPEYSNGKSIEAIHHIKEVYKKCLYGDDIFL